MRKVFEDLVRKDLKSKYDNTPCIMPSLGQKTIALVGGNPIFIFIEIFIFLESHDYCYCNDCVFIF
jgi:hypothetical protein